MTIQVCSPRYGASKAALLEGLRTTPERVEFHDPSIFTKAPYFTGASIPPGAKFPVVMDHPKRSRFATVGRKLDGTLTVK